MPFIDFGVADPAPSATGSVQTPRNPTSFAVEPERQPTADRLLSYTESQWYFIHRGKNQEGEREYRIVSLPVSKVSYARVVPLGSWNSRVAPFPWTEDAVSKATEACPVERVTRVDREPVAEPPG